MEGNAPSANSPIANRQSATLGFTLVELLVTIGVASIIAAAGAFGYVSLTNVAALRSATDTITLAFTDAQAAALNNLGASNHGVDVAPRTLTVYAGDSAPGTTVQTFSLPNGTQIVSGTGDVNFTRLTGETGGATIIVTNGNADRTITVSSTGVVNVQ